MRRSGEETASLSSPRWRACDACLRPAIFMLMRASFHKGKRKFGLRSGLGAEMRVASQQRGERDGLPRGIRSAAKME